MEDGFTKILTMVENFKKDPLETGVTWNFEDINPFLESKLREEMGSGLD